MTDAAPITEGTVEANGLTFGYLSAGEGPLALCLHGFPDSPWSWRSLLPELAAAGFRAVAPFMRGYAPTDVPTDGFYQPGVLARDANALHGALGGDSDAVLIGHDWGALAAYPTAADQPANWHRMVAMSVPPPATVAKSFFRYDQLRMSWYMFFFQSPFAEGAVADDDLAFIDRLWQDWSPGCEAEDLIQRAKDALAAPENLGAALSYYRATLGDGPRDPTVDGAEAAAFLGTGLPTLYLHGANDGCMSVDLVDDSVLDALTHPESQIEVVADAGHFLQVEQPEVVNRLIVDFVTS